MSISGSYFTYNNISSGNYGLLFLNMDTEENKNVGGEVVYSTFKNRMSPKNNIIDFSYDEPLASYELEMFSETRINDTRFAEILLWLKQPTYRELKINNNPTYLGYHFNCYFSNISRFDGGGYDGWGKYGIKATINFDSSFMWSNNEVSATYTNAQLSAVVTHTNESHLMGYTYPTLAITVGTIGGDITIQNVTDDNRLTKFIGLLPNEVVTLTVDPKIVTSSTGLTRYSVFNKKWFRLLQGDNKVGIIGDVANITISYEKARLIL